MSCSIGEARAKGGSGVHLSGGRYEGYLLTVAQASLVNAIYILSSHTATTRADVSERLAEHQSVAVAQHSTFHLAIHFPVGELPTCLALLVRLEPRVGAASTSQTNYMKGSFTRSYRRLQ